MNLIFGRENAQALTAKYTVLELDTFKMPGDNELVVFCAVENIPIMELPKVESMRSLHENLMINYRKKDWNYCTQALEHLMGFWNHELDTFYASLSERIKEYTEQDPGDNWTGAIDKTVS